MKAKTQIRIGLITAVIFVCFFFYKYASSWVDRPFDITIIFVSVYAFALITKKLVIAKGMFALWLFFNLLHIYRFTLDLFESPKEHIGVYLTTVFLTGLMIVLLGIGIKGLRQIMEEQRGVMEGKASGGESIEPEKPKDR